MEHFELAGIIGVVLLLLVGVLLAAHATLTSFASPRWPRIWPWSTIRDLRDERNKAEIRHRDAVRAGLRVIADLRSELAQAEHLLKLEKNANTRPVRLPSIKATKRTPTKKKIR